MKRWARQWSGRILAAVMGLVAVGLGLDETGVCAETGSRIHLARAQKADPHNPYYIEAALIAALDKGDAKSIANAATILYKRLSWPNGNSQLFGLMSRADGFNDRLYDLCAQGWSEPVMRDAAESVYVDFVQLYQTAACRTNPYVHGIALRWVELAETKIIPDDLAAEILRLMHLYLPALDRNRLRVAILQTRRGDAACLETIGQLGRVFALDTEVQSVVYDCESVRGLER